MKIYQKYGSLLKHFILDLYVVEGSFDDAPLKILVAEDGTTLEYVSELAFPDGAKVNKIGKTSATNSPDLIDNDADVVVVGANKVLIERYTERGFRIIPKWVRMLMPVKEDPYAWFSSFGRRSRSFFNRKIHRIEEAGYQCEVVNDEDSFIRFYNDMYKPYSLQRFNDDAVVYEPDVLKKFYERGFLAISRRNGMPAAAVLAYQEDNILRLPFGGITDGNGDLVKEGAMFAIHYFLAQQAHLWGCSFIDFGRSRPFLTDGILQYKMAWHTEAVPCDDVASVFALATPGNTPQGIKFLQAQPHFYLDGDKCVRSDE